MGAYYYPGMRKWLSFSLVKVPIDEERCRGMGASSLKFTYHLLHLTGFVPYKSSRFLRKYGRQKRLSTTLQILPQKLA